MYSFDKLVEGTETVAVTDSQTDDSISNLKEYFNPIANIIAK